MYYITESVDLLTNLPQWAGLLVTALSCLLVGVISLSNTLQGADFFRTDVIAATADLTATIAHGLGAISNSAKAPFRGDPPVDVTLTPIAVDFYLSEWIVSSVNTTNVILVKRSQSLSGNAAPQCQLTVRRPHSIGR